MKFVLPLLFLFGCSDNPRNTTTGTTGSTNGSSTGSTGGSTGTGGMGDMAMQPGGGGCLDVAKLVYVVDENNTFLSFDPATLQFAVLGTLSCPNTSGDNPFSMAVDRSATAWVLYASGRIFKVEITNNVKCTGTTFATSQEGFELFGMGFAANALDSNDETLFIAGGDPLNIGLGSSQFGTISFPALDVSNVGSVEGWPELTGTGDAKLWGFYPDTSPPKVAQIDKTNGSELETFDAPMLQGTPEAWAFAFWGGDFWIFLKRASDASTTVYQVKSSDGSVTPVKMNTGRKIVGAGVSTCAPTTVG